MNMEKIKQIQYYLIIGVVSVIALFFLPMLGSSSGLAWNIPDTTVGWIVYVTSKIIVATINILIFHCFILQGKQNISNNEKYIEGRTILLMNKKNEEERPKSPSEWHKTTYGKKAVTIFITSLLSAFGLTQAVLVFDWVSMLTYLFTIIMAIIFGILQMNSTEIYWTDEFWQYAKNIELIQSEEKNDSDR